MRSTESRTVHARAEPLRLAASRADSGTSRARDARSGLLAVLRGLRRDFGTTLTPRELASRLGTTARGTESPGAWVFEPRGSAFVVYANAMSIDSPVDWLRVTIGADLAIRLLDLTQLFSNDYDLSRGTAESMTVEFTANRRMYVAAELRNERPAYVSLAPVKSLQLRRPGYDPSVGTLAPGSH